MVVTTTATTPTEAISTQATSVAMAVLLLATTAMVALEETPSEVRFQLCTLTALVVFSSNTSIASVAAALPHERLISKEYRILLLCHVAMPPC